METLTKAPYCNAVDSLNLEAPEYVRGLQVRGGYLVDKGAPLYPRLAAHPDVAAIVERAAQAAAEVLDELFPGVQNQETRGVSSNLQGTLQEHIQALLEGKEGATRSWTRYINPLFATDEVFGKVRQAGAHEGFTVCQVPGSWHPPKYFDSDKKAFVELSVLGDLFTSAEATVQAVLDWLESHEISPRSVDLKLCLIDFSEKPFKVVDTAATRPATAPQR